MNNRWKCKKCGAEVFEYEAIKNYYKIDDINGTAGSFVSSYDGESAELGYSCDRCGKITKKHTLRALKRSAKWEEE